MQNAIRLATALVLLTAPAVGDAQEPAPIAEPTPPAHVDEKVPVADPALRAAARAAAHAASERPERRIPGGYLAGIPGREPVFGDTGDGSPLVLGNTYRMTFEPDAATYTPFLGSDAPRTWPVRLSVRSVRTDAGELPFARDAEPVRDGARVTYDRGSFVEVWDLSYESVEQSFVVRERVGPGALVIELDVESDLARSRAERGLVLGGELGGVRYSDAVAIDARGERVAAPTRWRDGRIEIEVPADAVDRLAFPLVVDPVLTSFSIEIDVGGPGATISSPVDAAYDVTAGTWCFVHERKFAGTLRDVHLLFVQDGSTLYRNFLLASTMNPSSPRVANNRASGQFLVVASIDGLTGFQRIVGRLYENLSSPQSPVWNPVTGVINISPDGFDAVNPDVGGDASTATPGYYCVTWERIFNSSDHDILVQMVRTSGTLFGSTIYLSNSSALDGTPSIASTNGKSRSLIQNWTIAWARVAGFLTNDLYGGRIRWDGVVSNTPFGIDISLVNTSLPSVSSPTDDLSPFTLIAYSRGGFGSFKTWGYVYEGSLFKAHTNLTAMTGADPSENHVYPNVDCDGREFVLVDTETWLGTTLYATYVSTLSWFANALRPSESHVIFGSSPSSEAPQAYVACQGASGGPPRRTLVTYSYGDDDLRGTYYDATSFTSFCHAGQDGVPACPCGNAPSGPGRGCDNSSQTGGGRLTATGAVDPDTVTLTASDLKPSTVCIFAQAHLVSTTGVALGDGLQCVAGTVRRLGAKMASGGVATFPEPGDPSITARSAAVGDTILPGTERYYYVFYRDQSSSWACSAPANVTSSLRVSW